MYRSIKIATCVAITTVTFALAMKPAGWSTAVRAAPVLQDDASHLEETALPNALNFAQLPGAVPFGQPNRPIPPHGPLPWPPVSEMHPPAPPFPPPFAAGFGPPAATRLSCEMWTHRMAATAALIRLKLRLEPHQAEAWRKLEQATDPAITKLQSACDRLPRDPNGLSLVDMTERLQDELAARLELLTVSRAPLRALYDMLSPAQRATLQESLLPPHSF